MLCDVCGGCDGRCETLSNIAMIASPGSRLQMAGGAEWTVEELVEMIKETEEDIDEAERDSSASAAMDVIAGERRLRKLKELLAQAQARQSQPTTPTTNQ